MADVFGQGDFRYRLVEGWPRVPGHMILHECPGVAVDSQDRVYLLTRGDYPIIVFDRAGNYLRSFGQGHFSKTRTHGLYIAHDNTLMVADDGIHTIQMFTPDGQKLGQIGETNKPAPAWSGEPFNRPTSAAIRPSNGDIYISDGYGNSRVHVYSKDHAYKFSWGSPGIDAGQFMRCHNIAFDQDERVYVVDREAHRVQIFDPQGNFITMWNNIYRPDCMVCWNQHIYLGELNAVGGLEAAPNQGHRVCIFDLNGKMVSRFGAPFEGSGPGEFYAPHGIAVDSQGSIYVAEVSFTMFGSRLKPPVDLRSISKYERV
ncbi:MAG: hypothetical protein HY680_09125 [Chloroflexi bacterium]|nr:hypothetical protein [Chloroflexota bacterium]